MLDRMAVLLEERAGELAAIDGVPVATRHLHGAWHDAGLLLRQAFERLAAGPPAGSLPAAEAPPASPAAARVEPVAQEPAAEGEAAAPPAAEAAAG